MSNIPTEITKYDLSLTREGKKVLEILKEKGIPRPDFHIFRTDSDSYSHGILMIQTCWEKGKKSYFEVSDGYDDVYFFFVDDIHDLLRRFTDPNVKFFHVEDVGDEEEEDEEE